MENESSRVPSRSKTSALGCDINLSLTSYISRNVNKSNPSNRGRYTSTALRDTDCQNPHGSSAGPCSDFVAGLAAARIRQFESLQQTRLAARIDFLHSARGCRACTLWHLRSVRGSSRAFWKKNQTSSGG